MKLRNKKTGEIRDFGRAEIISCDPTNSVYDEHFCSLSELNEKWEDYKEPEIYYRIDSGGFVYQSSIDEYPWSEPAANSNKAIGNYFETEEEAEKVVEKLKAWKRLKDKGFRTLGWEWRRMPAGGGVNVILDYPDNLEVSDDFEDDLDLLFSGEEF